MAAPPHKPRAGALGFLVVAGAVLLLSWLALRTMGKRLGDSGAAPPAVSATTGRDEAKPLVPAIPKEIVDDAGKTPIARIDLVLRVDGIDVSSEGAPVCRKDAHTVVGREPNGSAGSFNENALRNCLATVVAAIPEKRPVVTITRAGDAVPTTYLDALIAALKRFGFHDVVPSP